MKIKNLENKKIAILGFGKEGQSTLHFLKKRGLKDITILDSKEVNFEDTTIKSITGEIYLDSLNEFDYIFKTPGISPFHEKILPHRGKCISQAEVFFSEYSGKVIGITGTKGKSTISTLTYTCLLEAGYKVKLVGNIGSPVLDELDLEGEILYDFIVYELSSYMLQDFSPNLYIGVLNNIYPCHLDWHYDSFSIYKEAKINILRNAEIKIINRELHEENELRAIKSEKIFFSEPSKYSFDDRGFLIDGEYIYIGNIGLQGDHNKKNISGVLAILDSIVGDKEKLEKVCKNILPIFVGLPNRIENIGTYEGITFINDSIATTPESTIAAIKTFSENIQTLFLGGENSGFKFDALRKSIINSRINNIVAFPDTSELIFPEIEKRDYEIPFEIEIEGKSIQFIKTRSMKSGVDFSYKTTFPGKIALLSCAAPSFSLWNNYIEKANDFKKEVQEY